MVCLPRYHWHSFVRLTLLKIKSKRLQHFRRKSTKSIKWPVSGLTLLIELEDTVYQDSIRKVQEQIYDQLIEIRAGFAASLAEACKVADQAQSAPAQAAQPDTVKLQSDI